MYTRPDGEIATPGHCVSTRRGAGAFSVEPFGWVTGDPIAVRRGVTRREAVIPVGGVGRRDHVLDVRDLRGLAPSDTPVGRLHDPLAVQRREARRALEDDVDRAVVPHDRAGALVVEDVARDVGRGAESRPAVR